MVQSRLSTVAVVGLGKIGLPLAVQYARHGRRVIGCDIDQEVVDTINAGQSHVQEEPELATELERLVGEGLLSATRIRQRRYARPMLWWSLYRSWSMRSRK